MPGRGLSAEEKRVKLLEIFHESKDFYQLRELEKLGPKLKGIVSQSVKEVLQSLVDDGLVQADKIGSSNFFWSFPSERGAMMMSRLSTVQETNKTLKSQISELKAAVEEEKRARPQSNERLVALEELAKKKEYLSALETELAQYGACDPVQVELKRRAVDLAHEAAVRWTDNYAVFLSYFTRQHSIDASEVRSFLNIGEDYEDIS